MKSVREVSVFLHRGDFFYYVQKQKVQTWMDRQEAAADRQMGYDKARTPQGMDGTLTLIFAKLETA